MQHLQESSENQTKKFKNNERQASSASTAGADFDLMTSSSSSNTPIIDQIYKNIVEEEKTANRQNLPRLFMSQGSKDPLVQYPWAKTTFTSLRVSSNHINLNTLHKLMRLWHSLNRTDNLSY